MTIGPVRGVSIPARAIRADNVPREGRFTVPVCKLCKTTLIGGARFCGACGTPSADAGPPAGASRPSAKQKGGDDDLFAALGSPSNEATLDDLFSSLPDAAAQGAGAGARADKKDGPRLDDLFAAPATGEQVADLDDFFETGTIKEVPSATKPARPAPAPAKPPPPADDLFGGTSPVADPDTLFQPTGRTGAIPTISAKAAGGSLEELFGLATPAAGPAPDLRPPDRFDPMATSREPTVDSLPSMPDLSASVPGTAPPSGSTAAAFAALMSDRSEPSGPVVPGLERGDVLAEAHRVADGLPSGDGHTAPRPEPEAGTEEAAASPRDRRKGAAQRRPLGGTFLAPPETPTERLARLGGFLLAAGLAGFVAVPFVPLDQPYPGPTLGLGVAGIGVVVAAITKGTIPLEVQSRLLLLAAAVLVLPHGLVEVPATPPTLLPWVMLAILGAGVAHMLFSSLLATPLKLGFAIVGVYGCLSLAGALGPGTPYAELVTRRILVAPGLAPHLAPDRLELLLKAFDPLFVGVNFFLPAALAAAFFEVFALASRRWWGRTFAALFTCLALALGLMTGVKIADGLGVPNLRTLVKGELPAAPKT